MSSKSVVSAIVRRNSHNSSRSVSCQYIVGNPDWNSLVVKWIDSIRSGKYSRYFFICYAFSFCATFGCCKIVIHSSLLFACCYLLHILAFGSKHHKCYSEYSIGTSSKNIELDIRVFHTELHFCSFATTDPVTLCFFYRVAPVYFL